MASMEKQNNSQLELFSQLSASAETKKEGLGNLPLSWIRGYEKTILIVIAMLITGIVSFSLGVEKGKTAPKEKQGVVKNNPIPQDSPVIQEEQQRGYTIQLASYKTKEHAEKEAETLQQKGHAPLILTKGSYIVLCVGSFSDKEKARILLSQFDKRYKGCYIRKL